MTAPLRVLLIEDVESDAKLVLLALHGLARPIEHARVESAATMRAALTSASWDLVLSDWSMPTFSAGAALAVLREAGLDLPFIIVSGTIGEEAAVDAMRAGAHDYVLKDRLSRLVPAVERELREAANRATQRSTEAQLRSHEARFQALVEKSHDGILLMSRAGKTLYVSPAARRIIGVAGGTDLDAFAFIHPEDRARVDAFRREIMALPNASATIELRALLPDGTIRWLEATGTNLLDDPVVGAVVGNFRDVTEQRSSLEALRASEARFARLSDSGIIGIVVAEVTGRVFEINDAGLRMMGYTRDEAMSGPIDWLAMTPPEWQPMDLLAGQQLAEKGFALPWEKELIRKDGSRVAVLIGVAMLDYPTCITFLADITERKRAEDALRRTEEQLRHTQKMDAVSRLAGGMAHDFNNILSVILTYAGLLLDELRPSDPMRDDLEQIKRAANRAANLTRQLLLFSRQQVLKPSILDLNELLQQMDDMIHRLVGEDVELVLSPDPALGRVKIDPGHVEQVVMNLVVNARDAMPTGGKLTIETANVVLDDAFAQQHLGVRPGPHVMLAVSDTGVGMDRATQARMFEPFFTTKAVGKGTGLGLSTVFGIVQQSGGTIWVYSEPSHGTTFKVYLPRFDEQVDALPSVVAPSTKRGTETILLVEDEEQLRVVVRGILRRMGYEVLEAHDVAEALRIGESHDAVIHMLLTDVVMPLMSGPELAQRLVDARPGMKVLFMSGYTDDSVVRHGVLESHTAFVQKPFTTESLTTKVREILDAAPEDLQP